MISILFPILSLVGAVVTVLVGGIHPLWGIPLFFSFLVAVNALFFLFAILVSLPVKKQDPPSAEKRPQSRFYRFLLLEAYGIALQFMRVHVTVTGKEHLPRPGETFLLVSNHLSNYDHMIMMVKLRRHRLAFVSKPENYDIPVIGKYLQQSAFLPIDRQNALNAVRTIRNAALSMEEGSLSYGIFPEGTRSRTGELLPFHDGVFFAAKRAKVPVVVVHMSGTRDICHRGPFHATHVRMDILARLDAEFVRTHKDTEIGETVRTMMTESEEKQKAAV